MSQYKCHRVKLRPWTSLCIVVCTHTSWHQWVVQCNEGAASNRGAAPPFPSWSDPDPCPSVKNSGPQILCVGKKIKKLRPSKCSQEMQKEGFKKRSYGLRRDSNAGPPACLSGTQSRNHTTRP